MIAIGKLGSKHILMFTLNPDLDPLYVECFLCADSSVGYVMMLLHNWIKRFMDYEDLNGLTRQ